MNREQNFRRYSMNIPNVEQERLQGWLTIANAVETGQYSTVKRLKRGRQLPETFFGRVGEGF